MGTFLGFSAAGRLIATRDVALHPGAVPPSAVFAEEVAAVEVRPEVLVKVRPAVWQALVGHASRSAVGVQVDTIEQIRASLTAAEVARLERDLVAAAEAVALRQQAGRLLQGGLPPVSREDLARMERRLRELDTLVARARAGVLPAQLRVPTLLGELAGKELPL